MVRIEHLGSLLVVVDPIAFGFYRSRLAEVDVEVGRVVAHTVLPGLQRVRALRVLAWRNTFSLHSLIQITTFISDEHASEENSCGSHALSK